MAKKSEDDLLVTLPLKRLEKVLEAVEKVEHLTKIVDKLTSEQTALRGQFLELMEHLREIEKYL